MKDGKREIKPVLVLIGLIFTTAGLAYIFLGLDLIPNHLGFIGYLDDAAVILALWILYHRIKKKVTKKNKK